MPTPVAHSLAGIALLALMLPSRKSKGIASDLREYSGWIMAALVLSNLPDMDFLPGILSGDLNAMHHGYTHSIGWITLVSCSVALMACAFKAANPFFLLVITFALTGLHLVMDMASKDGRAPFGIMVLWPFDDTFRQWPVILFDHVHKAGWHDMIQWANVRTVAREIILCGPVLLGAYWWRRRI